MLMMLIENRIKLSWWYILNLKSDSDCLCLECGNVGILHSLTNFYELMFYATLHWYQLAGFAIRTIFSSHMTEPKISLNCTADELLKVRFINGCDKPIQILWVTHTGEYQLYATLRTRQFLDVNTYMRHAWVFKETVTGNRVWANNRLYFYGANDFANVKLEDRARSRFSVVLSKARVEKLEKICINVISRYIKKCTDVKYLEIPTTLKGRLIKKVHMSNPPSHSTDE